MKAQEVFDVIVTHLYTQGRPARNVFIDKCQYFDARSGRQCAIGCLIDPSKYPEAAQFKGGLDDLIDSNVSLPTILKDKQLWSLLRRLQHAHDCAHNLEDLIEDLKDIAIAFNLQYRETFYPLPTWKYGV